MLWLSRHHGAGGQKKGHLTGGLRWVWGTLQFGKDVVAQYLELDAAAHEEHIEIVERDGNVLERASRGERRVAGDQLDLRLDVLVGSVEIEGR